MRPQLILLAILSTSLCTGQSASFEEIKLKPNPNYYSTKVATIIFPIVLTRDSKTDSLINSQIKEDIFQYDTEAQTLMSLLSEHIESGLINLSYQVSYNRSGVLSLSIYKEACGAYCSSSESYFNFDLSTGRKVSIDEIFLNNKIDSFKTIVQLDKINSLTKYKIEEKNFLLNNEIDSTTYDWAVSYVDENCINHLSTDQFSISDNSIEIIDRCEFPHAIRSQTPTIELKYPYHSIAKFLTPKFRNILK